jgi:hypothetical protein
MNFIRTTILVLLLFVVASEAHHVFKFVDEDEGEKPSPPGAGTCYFQIKKNMVL